MITTYKILDIPYVTDGDSLWVVRERSVGDADGLEILQRDYAGGRKIRLDDFADGLNTPEKKKDPLGYAAARADLQGWVNAFKLTRDFTGRHLTLVTKGKKDQYGRLLANIVHPDDSTVVQYMRNLGWRSYK